MNHSRSCLIRDRHSRQILLHQPPECWHDIPPRSGHVSVYYIFECHQNVSGRFMLGRGSDGASILKDGSEFTFRPGSILPSVDRIGRVRRGPFEASTSISKRAAVSVEVSGCLLWGGDIESFH